MLDIIIRGGEVMDGTGKKAVRADVGILGDRIVEIGDLSSTEAERVIEAAGLCVAPGFIDIHSHGDWTLPYLPTANSKIHQGITLEVVGNCGSSVAPLSEAMREELIEKNRLSGIEYPVDWSGFGDYLDWLMRQGVSVNVAALVGHGTVREKVMGMSDRKPTPRQMKEMKLEVTRAMEEGAIGFSTGLIYTPNVYAGTEEIIELAKCAARLGGIYTSHIRGEADTLLEAIREALEVGRQAEMPVEISHFKASGVNNWHKMPDAIILVEAARAEGLDVMADMYSYPASNTELSSLIPPDIHVGGAERMIARLKAADCRDHLHTFFKDPEAANGVGWEGILICSCPSNPSYEGRSIQEISTSRGQNPVDAVMDILIETRLNADIIEFTMKEENVEMGLKQPFVSICTDASGTISEGPLSLGKPHPRAYGSFPRVLGRYAREKGLFSLEEAVRKMTSLPAHRLGLMRRGQLQPGYYADVVVFDPLEVRDAATYEQPHQYAVGIPWVLVNGQVVIENGRHTGARPGQIVA